MTTLTDTFVGYWVAMGIFGTCLALIAGTIGALWQWAKNRKQ